MNAKAYFKNAKDLVSEDELKKIIDGLNGSTLKYKKSMFNKIYTTLLNESTTLRIL